MKLTKFIPFSKVDEIKREVWGIVTAESVDKDGETCDYAKTKPYYKAWVEEFQKSTDGASFGNLREMHQLKAAGRGVGIEFRDEDKEIWMGFKVVDDAAWTKVVEKVYTGFSQGGAYVEGPDANGRYVANPSEVSLVDNPCLGVAHFAFIRSNGAVEMVKIKSVDDAKEPEMNAATKAYIEQGIAAALAELEKDGGSLSLAKKATMHGHLTKAMEHHDKMGECLANCMKAMGHEDEPDGDEDDMDKAKARKAATDAGLSGVALETFLSKFTTEEPVAETPEQKARKAGEAGGLTGEALDSFVAKSTGKVESLTKADVAQIVGEAIGEAMKAIFEKQAPAALPRQTVVPITKREDNGEKTPDPEKFGKEGTHNPDAAKALAAADKGTPLSNDDLIRLGLAV